MFSQCTYLSYIDLSDFDTSEVASMEQMFYYDSRLTSLDFSFSDLKKSIKSGSSISTLS